MSSGSPFDRPARRSGAILLPLGLLPLGLLMAGSPTAARAGDAATQGGAAYESAEHATPSTAPDTSPYVVLITNADSDIGYEFTRQYSERGWTVIAAVRNPQGAAQLNALAGHWNSNIHVEKLDATSERSVRALATRYQGKPIDLLINNVDMAGDPAVQKYGSYDFRAYDAILDANVEGPLRLIEALMDNVAASRQKKIMNLSSAAGSIQLAGGGLLFYRSSKAALNMEIHSLSRELQRDPDPRRRALVLGLIDPGSGSAPAPGPREAAEYCIAVIEGFTPATTGAFLDRKGATLPW